MSAILVCSECGGTELETHCPSPTCNWWRCKARDCRAFGYPGKRMVLPLGGTK